MKKVGVSFINFKTHNNIMPLTNFYSKIENFKEVTTDEEAIKIFLLIAKNKTRNINQLCEDTKIDITEIGEPIKNLINGDFIKRNPNPVSQKFKLGFNGQLFAEQLKIQYPSVRKLLGKENLIEPLRE